MFNFDALERVNKLRREELLEEAAQERLAREPEGDSRREIARFKGLLKRFASSTREKSRSYTISAKTLTRLLHALGERLVILGIRLQLMNRGLKSLPKLD